MGEKLKQVFCGCSLLEQGVRLEVYNGRKGGSEEALQMSSLFFWPDQMVCPSGMPESVGGWDNRMCWEKGGCCRRILGSTGDVSERKGRPCRWFATEQGMRLEVWIWISEVLQSSTCFPGRGESNSAGDWSAATTIEYLAQDFGLIPFIYMLTHNPLCLQLQIFQCYLLICQNTMNRGDIKIQSQRHYYT